MGNLGVLPECYLGWEGGQRLVLFLFSQKDVVEDSLKEKRWDLEGEEETLGGKDENIQIKIEDPVVFPPGQRPGTSL